MDEYGEPLFDWRPVLFFGWMAFVMVGAWVTATIKSRTDTRHGFQNWLTWFGGLFAVGMAVGLVYVGLIWLHSTLAALGDLLPGVMG
jgi:hypothetical protein